eukprot:756546-Pyramimonas_sp.AAC.1
MSAPASCSAGGAGLAGAGRPPGHAGQPGHGGQAAHPGNAGHAGIVIEGQRCKLPPQRYARAPCHAYWAAGQRKSIRTAWMRILEPKNPRKRLASTA